MKRDEKEREKTEEERRVLFLSLSFFSLSLLAVSFAGVNVILSLEYPTPLGTLAPSSSRSADVLFRVS